MSLHDDRSHAFAHAVSGLLAAQSELLAPRVAVTLWAAETRTLRTLIVRAVRSTELPGFVRLEEWGVTGIGVHARRVAERAHLVPPALVYGAGRRPAAAMRGLTAAELEELRAGEERSLALLRSVECPCRPCTDQRALPRTVPGAWSV